MGDQQIDTARNTSVREFVNLPDESIYFRQSLRAVSRDLNDVNGGVHKTIVRVGTVRHTIGGHRTKENAT